MSFDEIISLVEFAYCEARSNGYNPIRVCMNSKMADIVHEVEQTQIAGLTIKIIDALPDGKVIVE